MLVTYKNEAEWLEARKGYITSTDIPCIMGRGYISAYSLAARKLGLEDTDEVGEALRWGNRLESAIALGYGEDAKRDVQPQKGFALWVHSNGWAAASSDGLERGLESEKPRTPPSDVRLLSPWGLMEIKNVGQYLQGDWADGEIPQRFYDQVQWGMYCSNYDRAVVVALIGGNKCRWKYVDRDQDHIDHLVRSAEMFQGLILNGKLPAIDGHASSKVTFGKISPKKPGKTIELSYDDMAIWEQLGEAKAAQAQAKKEVEVLNNRVKEALGDAETGVMPDGSGKLERVTVQKKEFTVKASSYEQVKFRKAK